MIDSVEIPTAILWYSMHDEFKESVPKLLRQRPTTGNSNMLPKPEILYLTSTWYKTPELSLEYRHYL